LSFESVLVTCFTSTPCVPKIMSSWFGLGRKAESLGTSAPVRALPATWYHSPAMYELERRAVFSKKWILVSHKLRFVNAGDFVCITEAGFPFFLIKDRVGNINAFHNVCRHRAYPVIEKGSGTASVLACKYHGKLSRLAPYRNHVNDFL
jgi:nitrite reductase/ring-hydroxylating ferredoxin subunit